MLLKRALLYLSVPLTLPPPWEHCSYITYMRATARRLIGKNLTPLRDQFPRVNFVASLMSLCASATAMRLSSSFYIAVLPVCVAIRTQGRSIHAFSSRLYASHSLSRFSPLSCAIYIIVSLSQFAHSPLCALCALSFSVKHLSLCDQLANYELVVKIEFKNIIISLIKIL